jgi:hypothetical protein
MAFTAKEKSDYKPILEGTHRAVSSALVDIGLQDAFGAVKPQLMIRFEFPDLRVKRADNGVQTDEPMVKWQFYTNSLNKKANLRRDLDGWRGRGFTKEELEGFDVRTVIGHACQISIIHDNSGDRVRDKINTISKLMGDGTKPLPELEVIRYSREEDETSQWDLLPEWIQEKIDQQVVDDIAIPPATAEVIPFEDDDVPF